MDPAVVAVKTAFKNVVPKSGEFKGNKIIDAVTKSSNDMIVKQEPVAKIIMTPEKRDEILNNMRRVL